MPLAARPQSMAVTSEMYVPAEAGRRRVADAISPKTAPYAASSHIIPGSIAATGMAVMRYEITGAMMPQASPQPEPHKAPQSRTGRCIGRNILPAFGMACSVSGRTIASAVHMAAQMRRAVRFIISVPLYSRGSPAI